MIDLLTASRKSRQMIKAPASENSADTADAVE
jgi:hypothetical protein